MRTIFVILILLALMTGIVQAQPMQVWDYNYSNSGGNHCMFSDGALTLDSGFVFVGTIWAPIEPIMWLLKLDRWGEVQWNGCPLIQQLGITVNACALDLNGHLIVVGKVPTLQGDRGWIAKFNVYGQFIWYKQDSALVYSMFNDVAATEAGGYVVTGAIGSGYSGQKITTIWHYDAQGNKMLENYYDELIAGEGMAICLAENGGCTIAAQQYINYPGGIFTFLKIYETDSQGIVTNEESYTTHNMALSIVRATDSWGGYFVATNVGVSGCIMRLSRFFTGLQKSWETILSDPQYPNTYVKSLYSTDDYTIFAGNGYNSMGNGHGIVGKLDNYTGSITWQQSGESDWMVWCGVQYDGGYTFGGNNKFPNNYGKLLKFVDPTGIENEPSPVVARGTDFSASPNPFNPVTTINYQLPATNQVTLNIYDLSGRLVTELVNSRQMAGEHTVNFNGSNLASGVYLCRIQLGSYVATQKLVLAK